MSFLEDFETLIVEAQHMGGWVQRNNHLTHVSQGLNQEIAAGLAEKVSKLHNYYGEKGRIPEVYILTYESARLVVVSLTATRCGLIIPKSGNSVSAAVEDVKKVIFLNTLELLQAPVLCDLSQLGAKDSLDVSDPDFDAWDDVLLLARAELRKIMNAGQVEVFIKMKLKGFEVLTVSDAQTAVTRIADGVPDRSKASVFLDMLESKIKELVER